MVKYYYANVNITGKDVELSLIYQPVSFESKLVGCSIRFTFSKHFIKNRINKSSLNRQVDSFHYDNKKENQNPHQLQINKREKKGKGNFIQY